MNSQHKPPSAHARLSPSGYHWLYCPAAPRLSVGAPDVESRYAAEGTAAHKVFEQALISGALFRADCETEEQYEALRIAFDAVDAERRRYASELLFQTETRVYPSNRGDIFGTADVIIAGILESGETGVTVADLKYGKNVAVAADTPQLAIYLLGASALVGLPVEHFRSVIIQPRLKFGKREKVRSCDRTLKEMLVFSKEMHSAAALTDDPNAQPVEGTHCRWCKAKDACPAYSAKPARKKGDKDTFAFAFE